MNCPRRKVLLHIFGVYLVYATCNTIVILSESQLSIQQVIGLVFSICFFYTELRTNAPSHRLKINIKNRTPKPISCTVATQTPIVRPPLPGVTPLGVPNVTMPSGPVIHNVTSVPPPRLYRDGRPYIPRPIGAAPTMRVTPNSYREYHIATSRLV